MAGGTWDKLEQVFEDRVARALSKLGVYTQNDVQRLAARVDELADAVNKLIKASGGKAAAAGEGCARQARRRTRRPPKKAAPQTRNARRRSRNASRVSAPRVPAVASRARPSLAIELVDLLDVVLHRLVLAHSLELGPGVVLGAADEIEAARAIALHVAVGRLLVVRVELEQRRVVGFLARLLGGRGRGFELRLDVVLLRRRPSLDPPPGSVFPGRGVCATLARSRKRSAIRAMRPRPDPSSHRCPVATRLLPA